MSWDVCVMKCAAPPPPVAEMPADFAPDPLGPADDVRAAISAVLPSVSWSDPTWGIYDGKGFSLEFCIGKEALVETFSILVRGGGDPIPSLLALASRNGWYMMDLQTPEWLHHSPDVSESWKQFQEWRNRAIEQSGGSTAG